MARPAQSPSGPPFCCFVPMALGVHRLEVLGLTLQSARSPRQHAAATVCPCEDGRPALAAAHRGTRRHVGLRRGGSEARLEVGQGPGGVRGSQTKSNAGSKGRSEVPAPPPVVGEEPFFSQDAQAAQDPKPGVPPTPASPVGSPAGPTVLNRRPPQSPWNEEWNRHFPQEEK